jgi:hypothetical protein
VKSESIIQYLRLKFYTYVRKNPDLK